MSERIITTDRAKSVIEEIQKGGILVTEVSCPHPTLKPFTGVFSDRAVRLW